MAVDLEALDDFLLSGRAPDNSMGLADLDGFLTGIVVGPELILPSEWLPIVWGGDEPDFANVGEAEAILGTIAARYTEIATNLDTNPRAFDPVFWERPDGELIVTDWAAGFLDSVRLRAPAWEPLILHREAQTLRVVAPLRAGYQNHERSAFPLPLPMTALRSTA